MSAKLEAKSVSAAICLAAGILVSATVVFSVAAQSVPPAPDFPLTLLTSLPVASSSSSQPLSAPVPLNMPSWSPIQGHDGNFYGTAIGGGISDGGGVYSVTPTGTYQPIYDFTSTTGNSPRGALLQGSDGLLYGTLTNFAENNTSGGAIAGLSTIGQEQTLHTFANYTMNGLFDLNVDGAVPEAGLVQTHDGLMYGVTYTGGSTGGGTVYSVSPSGSFTTLYTFPAYGSDTATSLGTNPFGALALGVDGNLYGITGFGGANGQGTIFRITPAGTLTPLQSFPAGTGGCGNAAPQNTGLLALGADGSFYGAHCAGGSNGTGYLYKFNPATDTITSLHDFAADRSGNTGGSIPNGSLVTGPDGNFYGTTQEGGTNNTGMAFALSPAGTFTPLYSFSSSGSNDGLYPFPLAVGSDNDFYGTALAGGTYGKGSFFKFQHLPQNDLVMTTSSGLLDVRLLNSLGIQQVLQNVAQGYYPVAVGDFDGDGVPDILWTSANRDLYLWLGGKGSSTGFKPTYVGTYPAGWAVIGAGDINGDGKADMLWINSAAHEFGYWLMNGATRTDLAVISYASGYYPIATGDFNGDGKTDVLWSSAKNDLYIWSSNVPSSNGHFISTYAGTFPTGWKLAGTGDLDGDRISDLVWMKNDGTQWGYWLMNGALRKTVVSKAIPSGSAGYGIVNVASNDTTNRADLVWSNGHDLYLWTNAGTCASSTCSFTSQQLVAPADGSTVFNSNLP